MDRTAEMWAGFLEAAQQEMAKEAVDAQELHKHIFGRARVRDMSEPQVFENPIERSYAEHLHATHGSAAAGHPRKMARAVRQGGLIRNGAAEQVRDLRQQIRDAERQVGMKAPRSVAVVDSYRFHPVLEGAIDRRTGLSPNTNTRTHSDRRALSAVLGAHEKYETGVKPRDFQHLPTGHASQGVLMKEHNLLSRLTGEGSEGAVRAMRSLRDATGENGQLREMLVRNFKDPRAAQFVRHGEKIPKAMQRAMLRKLREDPTQSLRHPASDHSFSAEIPKRHNPDTEQFLTKGEGGKVRPVSHADMARPLKVPELSRQSRGGSMYRPPAREHNAFVKRLRNTIGRPDEVKLVRPLSEVHVWTTNSGARNSAPHRGLVLQPKNPGHFVPPHAPGVQKAALGAGVRRGLQRGPLQSLSKKPLLMRLLKRGKG